MSIERRMAFLLGLATLATMACSPDSKAVTPADNVTPSPIPATRYIEKLTALPTVTNPALQRGLLLQDLDLHSIPLDSLAPGAVTRLGDITVENKTSLTLEVALPDMIAAMNEDYCNGIGLLSVRAIIADQVPVSTEGNIAEQLQLEEMTPTDVSLVPDKLNQQFHLEVMLDLDKSRKLAQKDIQYFDGIANLPEAVNKLLNVSTYARIKAVMCAAVTQLKGLNPLGYIDQLAESRLAIYNGNRNYAFYLNEGLDYWHNPPFIVIPPQ